MSNTNSKENKKNVIRSGLNLSLPFVLCAVALILLSIWLFKGVIEKNSYYKLLMNTSGSVDGNEHIFDGRLNFDNIAPDPDGTDETLSS